MKFSTRSSLAHNLFIHKTTFYYFRINSKIRQAIPLHPYQYFVTLFKPILIEESIYALDI
ncbi:hypothetical protein B1207_08805 [Legionella quinlivanii]|uniref:Uncharacterized protein n=1 Tax=Legionella quinlivanii TaxID=45073 RepID=A0A364LIL9_9GAMM|nr:hypothetical protein B1207_08805 [Legionella quinlivanii]